MRRQVQNAVRHIIFILCIATASVVAMSFTPAPASGRLIIHFDSYVGYKKLTLDTVTYTNALGQPFTVTNFKYYISNIALTGNDGKKYVVPDSYFLIRQDEKESWTTTLDGIPTGKYKSIDFTIGVDSLHNCSGAQSGALDPVNGMFWAWSTGYIFLKLEGRSPASTSPGGMFEYHIGGYRGPNNFIRNTQRTFTNPLIINGAKSTSIFIKTDVLEILKGPNDIDIAKLSSVTDFHHAAEIADNYADMFTIIRIENE